MPKSASQEPQSAEATEVESLAMGNREDFDREPVYPTYAMRTMVDPLADDPYNCPEGEGHETEGGLQRQSSCCQPASHATLYTSIVNSTRCERET
jgi:hypothetical protein